MATQKLPQTTDTTRIERKRKRAERAYKAASPSARRAVQVLLVMLTEGATHELAKAVALKLADMWADEDAPAEVQS
jgi:hypothetical protein